MPVFDKLSVGERIVSRGVYEDWSNDIFLLVSIQDKSIDRDLDREGSFENEISSVANNNKSRCWKILLETWE